MVHSLVLMVNSPVFRRMLETDMDERHTGEIKLPGKSRAEFLDFVDSLQIATQSPLTADSATYLSRWADEYQVDALLICPECGHEFSATASEEEGPQVRDSVGNPLADGDTVTVIKDLKVKGSSLVVKVGTKVRGPCVCVPRTKRVASSLRCGSSRGTGTL